VEELFKASIVECAENARPNILPPQTTEDLEFVFPVNQVIYLRTIDA
jgi:hypothetical protein